MRRYGLTTIFGNPGSTEIPFLTDLPPDIRFVLALHEGSVVGMASGYALARGEAAFVNLHTAAGLGNAVNAIANARDCRAPLVIVVGQQDRRQIAVRAVPHRSSPRTAGRRVSRLARPFRPAPRTSPARSPAPTTRRRPRVARRWSSSRWATGSSRPTSSPPPRRRGSCARTRSPPEQVAELADLLAEAESPALVVGAPGEGREPGMRWSRSPSGCAARCGRSPSAAPSASPRITRSSRAT